MNYLNQLTKTLDENYEKLPRLPKGVNDFIVSVAPWLALIFGVLGLISGLAAFGVLAVLSPFAMVAGAGKYAFTGPLMAIVLVVQSVIELWAFPSLKARKVRGWNLIYWSILLSVVSSVFSLSVFSILSAIIGALIGYYFLYNVKSYYK
jgi:hypothetical protein